MKKTPAARATRNALLNLFVMPGLGSLLAKRWIAGLGQSILVTAGSVMLFVWLFKVLGAYYDLMFGEAQPAPVGWIGITGGILFVVAWLWSGMTSFTLLQEVSGNRLESLQTVAAPPMPKLDDIQIAAALALAPHWTRQGDAIARTFQFKDFPAAMKFVDAVAVAAEQAWHHPDIDIRWNKVALTLTTHDAGGLTQKDFDLARQFDQLSLR
jgi:4a-hydroxytetrahydrobiopterin dehydratase